MVAKHQSVSSQTRRTCGNYAASNNYLLKKSCHPKTSHELNTTAPVLSPKPPQPALLLYIMASVIENRLLLLLPPSAISRKGALALSSSSAGVDGLRWWIDCQWNPTLQFELRLLLFLLEEHAIDILQLKVGSRPASSRSVTQLSVGNRHPLDRFSRVGSVNLKCSEWLRKVSTSEDAEDEEGGTDFGRNVGPATVHTIEESISIAAKLMMIYKTLVLPDAGRRPYQLVKRVSLQILILRASDLSNAKAETSFLEAELGLMQSRLRRAQTEVELLSDAVQYLTESNIAWSRGGAQPRRRLFVDQYKCQLDSSSNTGESFLADNVQL
ncbi:hypothetical protein C8R48DRAFT_671105 [Suillus tomentosus]|nr:hypothetical protein C8R48DRAFT_671105 [Suillus tomentosus]